MEDAINISRWQFALTTIYHFLFVPLSIGMAWFLVLTEVMYLKTKNQKYMDITKYWSKIFVISFAIGVATGLVQEFQFGMNWAKYSTFMGDIFGVPLALEALIAFFLESCFIGLWIYGWGKISPKLHALSIGIVAAASTVSAYFILVANSFMQNPVGYALNNGRAELVDAIALLTNPNVLYQFPHVIMGALTTAAFFIAGVTIWLLRKNDPNSKNYQMHLTTLKISSIAALLATLAVSQTGHLQTIEVFERNPMKMAAAEGMYESVAEDESAGLAMFAIIDTEKQEETFSIKVPYALSILLHSDIKGEIKGMKELQTEYVKQYGQGNYMPPVKTSFWAFRAMVFSGGMMMFIAAAWIFVYYRKKDLLSNKWFQRISLASITLPFIANTGGWILAEMGRQPWIVRGLLKTSEAVSPNLNFIDVAFSLGTFSVVYITIMVIGAKMIIHNIKQGDK